MDFTETSIMRHVLYAAVFLALTGSIASANMPAFTPDQSNVSKNAAKMPSPAYVLVANNSRELSFTMDFVKSDGVISAIADIGKEDFWAIAGLGGDLKVILWTTNRLHGMSRVNRYTNLKDEKAVLNFMSGEICDTFGTYTRFVLVTVSATHNNRNPMPGYMTPKGFSMNVTCRNSEWRGFEINKTSL